jgi:hypothetical protein
LGDAIAAAASAKSSAALVRALEGLGAGDGNVKTRRKLLRLLATIAASGKAPAPASSGAALLTSACVARLKEAQALLQPQPNTGARLLPLEEAAALGAIPAKGAKKSKKEEGAARKAALPAAVPHIVFFGQLPFDATTADVERLVRSVGVEGSVSVRMLSDRDGTPKGTAFATLDTAEEQHACLGLHHTMLRGRRINVEKSTGGSNKEKRTERLQAQREEQEAKIKSKIDSIIAEHAERGAGGLSASDFGPLLTSRLYLHTPGNVQAVLASIVSSAQEDHAEEGVSAVRRLDRALDALDRKLIKKSGGAATKRRRTQEGEGEGEEE